MFPMRIYADPEKMITKYEQMKPQLSQIVAGSLLPVAFIALLIQILFNFRLTGIPWLDISLFISVWVLWIALAYRHLKTLPAQPHRYYVEFDDEQITIKHGKVKTKRMTWPEVTKVAREDGSITLSTDEKMLGLPVSYDLDDIYQMKLAQLHEEVKVRWTAAQQRADVSKSAEPIAHSYERRYYRGIDLPQNNK